MCVRSTQLPGPVSGPEDGFASLYLLPDPQVTVPSTPPCPWPAGYRGCFSERNGCGGCQPGRVFGLGQVGEDSSAWAGPPGHHSLAVGMRPASRNNKGSVSSPTWPALPAPAAPADLSLVLPRIALRPTRVNPGWLLLSHGSLVGSWIQLAWLCSLAQPS